MAISNPDFNVDVEQLNYYNSKIKQKINSMLKLNNQSVTESSNNSWYAPTDAGTNASQHLVWDSTNNKPVWENRCELVWSGTGTSFPAQYVTPKIESTAWQIDGKELAFIEFTDRIGGRKTVWVGRAAADSEIYGNTNIWTSTAKGDVDQRHFTFHLSTESTHQNTIEFEDCKSKCLSDPTTSYANNNRLIPRRIYFVKNYFKD